jgi:isopentenyl-diphosphate delta-isomerase type 1
MEYFDVLDESGNSTGITKPRTEVHKDGDWHRAVHIWILNDKNELLLQKRSPNKDSCPNMWDISSAGHVSAGQTSIEAAVREIEEELGIKINETQLEYLFTYKIKNITNMGAFINNEFDDVYLVKLNLDISKVEIQQEELAEIKFMHYKQFEEIAGKEKDIVYHKEEYRRLFEILHQRLG